LTSRAELRARGLPAERELIDHIRRRLPAPPASVIVGPGDDAAVIAPERGGMQVLTIDALIEGIHFDRRFSSLADVGYKALAVNVSDLAAMGASPHFALLSLMLPDGLTLADVDLLLDGILEIAAATRVAIIGGNISRSPGPLILDVTAGGSVRPRRVLTRGGGKPGDDLYVTGSIGAAGAGLDWLRTHGSPSGAADGPAGMLACIRRHQRPEPRVRIGLLLGRNRAASACMDLSDGLADAVTQLAESSGTGATIEASALPIDPTAGDWFASRGLDPVRTALSHGDDYELLFAVPRKSRGRLRHVQRETRGVALTRIGTLIADAGVRLFRDGVAEELPQGFSHF